MEHVALYCPDARLLARSRAALGVGRAVSVPASWQELERHARRSSCVVAALEWLRGPDAVQRVAQLRATHPALPLVLITGKDADAIRELSRVRVEEIVWPHEVEQRLAAAVARAVAVTPLADLASRLAGLRLPPRLRRGMIGALTSSRPLTTVAQVAEAAQCDRRTLWRELRQLGRAELRLQDLLDWLLLLRLSVLKTPRRKWSGVAQEVGLQEQTISRMIERLTGLSRAQFTQAGPAGVMLMFEEAALQRLLAATLPESASGADASAEGT